ncbi:IclR family transcriptional regulator [Aquamicrobium sp. LC103]|uniref:IclR family transcriptional regulator n=1 Tax=Aquamicrobium sp. LC103 TaxID=1120658 RepID=UPI00063EA1EF|nr:IclR family transcriptional regulator [Aquamicrobium sp. LC103]TKT69441.1 IclR family transcriptional regulator [Aquamicrobium sp. LC103]
MKEADRHIVAVSAALEVLAAFDRDVPLRLKDLHERTGQNRSRLLRLLGTLENHGFVQSNSTDGTYELGGVLYRLGSLMNDRFSRVDATIRPVLKRLVAETGDTAFFSSVEGLRRVVVVAEESTEALRFTAREGQSRPLHLGASSKVLLAFADAETRERAMAMVSEDEHPAILKDIDEITANGFAVSRGEITPYGFAIAVPVTQDGGRVGALSLAGVLSKLSPDLIDQHVDRLRSEAARLELALRSPLATL